MDRFERREIAGGVFIIIGLVLLAWFLFAVGQREGIFKKGYTVSMQCRDLAGLKTGDPVLLKGLEIGYVRQVRFVTQETELLAEAVLFIFDRYHEQVPRDAVFRIESKDITGKHQVAVVFEEWKAPFLRDGDTVEGTLALDLEKLKTGMSETLASVQETSDEARRFVKQLQKKSLNGDLFKIF